MWGSKYYYNQWDDRVRGYLGGLNVIGIKASLMAHDDPNAPNHTFFEQMMIGGVKEACIKVWDKNMDFIELWRMEGKGGASVDIIYLVRANVGDHEKDFNASWTAPLGSFLKGGVREYRWEGGQLADLLNSDLSLTDALMPFQRAIKVRGNLKHQFVMVMENRNGVQTYPYPESRHMEAMDRVGKHIKMMSGTTALELQA